MISEGTGRDSTALLSPSQAAAYLGVTERTLAVWRCVGRYNIPYVKVGRLVKYRKSAIDDFLDSRTVRHTSEFDANHKKANNVHH